MLTHQATDVVNEPSLSIWLVYDVNFVGVVNKVGNLDILCVFRYSVRVLGSLRSRFPIVNTNDSRIFFVIVCPIPTSRKKWSLFFFSFFIFPFFRYGRLTLERMQHQYSSEKFKNTPFSACILCYTQKSAYLGASLTPQSCLKSQSRLPRVRKVL